MDKYLNNSLAIVIIKANRESKLPFNHTKDRIKFHA